jgi:hypothetical protein
MNNELFENVDQYINNLFVDQDDVLMATEASINEANIPPISISPNQGKFLQVLALPCEDTEIGTLAAIAYLVSQGITPRRATYNIRVCPETCSCGAYKYYTCRP